jgi:hypothetical protein
MPIILLDPADWESLEASTVQIDSDAPDNKTAIEEIEAWASQHGYARVNEYWLRPIIRNNKKIFRGICYRLDSEELESAKRLADESKKRRDSMIRTEFNPT